MDGSNKISSREKAIKSPNRSHSKYIISERGKIYLRVYVASQKRFLYPSLQPRHAWCDTIFHIFSSPRTLFWLFHENLMFTSPFLSLMYIIDANVCVGGGGPHPNALYQASAPIPCCWALPRSWDYPLRPRSIHYLWLSGVRLKGPSPLLWSGGQFHSASWSVSRALLSGKRTLGPANAAFSLFVLETLRPGPSAAPGWGGQGPL